MTHKNEDPINQDSQTNNTIKANLEIEDEVVKLLGDEDAQDLQAQHIEDLQDEWAKTVAEKHFNKAGMVLTELSFKNLNFESVLKDMLLNKECMKRINNHPFEWLDRKRLIKLFNILRAVDPNIKFPHEINKDAIRFNILEWLHIYNLLIEYKTSNLLSDKLQVNRMELDGIFSIRFNNLEHLEISENILTQFSEAQANSDTKCQNLHRWKWALVACAFAVLGLESFYEQTLIIELLSMASFAIAIAMHFYCKKIYPKRFIEQGRHEMICEKLIMRSF